MDCSHTTLRFLRRYGMPLVRASAFALPFGDHTFDCVISSEVIEHIPFDEVLFTEMKRVLRPGGMLVIGTPDYDTIGWRTIEPLYGLLQPGGYKDEHITHHSRAAHRDSRAARLHLRETHVRGRPDVRFRKARASPPVERRDACGVRAERAQAEGNRCPLSAAELSLYYEATVRRALLMIMG
jgi:SAM-dependent methyltransferase